MPSPERTLLFSRCRFIVGLALLVLGLVAAPVSAAAPPRMGDHARPDRAELLRAQRADLRAGLLRDRLCRDDLAAFAVVAVQRERGSVALDAFRGLGRRHPSWTAALVVSILFLLGLPLLAGFVGKLKRFTAAIDADQAWLAA